MRLPLTGGSYTARSIIASQQRCINYYPELNPPKSSLVPITHYQRPGLVPRVVLPDAPSRVRCLYQSSNRNGYVVTGNNVYQLDSNYNPTLLGSLGYAQLRTNPAYIIDNGSQALLVDGSPYGWTWNVVGTPNFARVNDPTGFFRGADRVDILDTFIVWNFPGTTQFGSTHSNQITPFDPTYFAFKSGYADYIETLMVNRHEMVLLGTLKSEAWYDAGNATFPFAELPGAYIEHGIEAKYSVASQDINIYWLSRNLQGRGIVLRYRGYTTTRISNHALEFAIREMARTVGTSDAIGYCYQQDGHAFYVLHFPAGDQTWVYDESIGDPVMAWHQEAWTDPNTGQLHRHRANCHAVINGENVVGDWENGTIYAMDLDAYTDNVNNNNGPVIYLRTFPHVGAGVNAAGQAIEAHGRRLQIRAFTADFEVGTTFTGRPELPQLLSMRWSRDRGRTWSDENLQNAGNLGDYLEQPIWRSVGEARYPVFELSHSIPGPAALNGAWIDAEVLTT